MEVYGFSHEIVSPRDAASGLPTGRRQHSPMRLVIRQSQATPLLLQAQSRNEVIPEVKILFFRPSQTGTEQQYFTYTLKNARITSFRTWAPNKQDPAATPYLPSSELAFTYETITWTYVDGGGVEHTDDWITNE